ncbi:hypothetical protein GGD66_005179 [Bradyrhizobium sp. CIR48]|nr:hypothetical protein [Bradyrhizobium sp. CIR48]
MLQRAGIGTASAELMLTRRRVRAASFGMSWIGAGLAGYPPILLPTRFVARSNIPSSAPLLRGHSSSRDRRLASVSRTLLRICRGP